MPDLKPQRKKRTPMRTGKVAKTSGASVGEGRKRRSSEDILRRIVTAAADEFERCGFAGATTASIAHKANVTEGQIFRHFGSKSNLFRETIFKPLDQQLLKFLEEDRAPERPEMYTPNRESASVYISRLQRFLAANREMLTSLVVAQTYDTGSAQGVGQISSLRAYFEHGAAVMRKQIKDPAKVDPKLMVRVSFVAVLACVIFKDWIFPPALATETEITNAIRDFILEGLSANHDPGTFA